MSDVKPHDNRDSWDDADVAELYRCWTSGKSVAETAYILGRTARGVKSKLYRAGINRQGWR